LRKPAGPENGSKAFHVPFFGVIAELESYSTELIKPLGTLLFSFLFFPFSFFFYFYFSSFLAETPTIQITSVTAAGL